MTGEGTEQPACRVFRMSALKLCVDFAKVANCALLPLGLTAAKVLNPPFVSNTVQRTKVWDMQLADLDGIIPIFKRAAQKAFQLYRHSSAAQFDPEPTVPRSADRSAIGRGLAPVQRSDQRLRRRALSLRTLTGLRPRCTTTGSA